MQLKEYKNMNITQISTSPVRIRIEDETQGTGGSTGGRDFQLNLIGEEYAVFVKVENTSEPPENG
jgi:hypothetical protein